MAGFFFARISLSTETPYMLASILQVDFCVCVGLLFAFTVDFILFK